MITKLGRVMIPVSNQDAALAFYTEKLGFTVAVDIPFGDGDRWIEIAPPEGGAAIALTTPMGDHWQPGLQTGIGLETRDARAAHAQLQGQGVDVDAEFMGGDGNVPLLFSFRDADGNSIMVAEVS